MAVPLWPQNTDFAPHALQEDTVIKIPLVQERLEVRDFLALVNLENVATCVGERRDADLLTALRLPCCTSRNRIQPEARS